MIKEEERNTKDTESFLHSRGLIYQKTNNDILNKPITFYVGIDLSGSLHVGHLVLIKVIDLLISYGHKAILITGSATTSIGDPTGKNSTRPNLSKEVIENNKKLILEDLKRVLKKDFLMLDNQSWLEEITLMDYLFKYGKYISINRMVKVEYIKNRLENNSNINLPEFLYMYLQGLDFVVLHEKYNCTVQFGGSDQWGNIISGIDLGGHLGYKLNAFTIPLLTTKDGKKMGKTESGALWLDPKKTSPYRFWQYFRSIDDTLVEGLLLIFSKKTDEEIKDLIKNNINEGKVILANIITEYAHGSEVLVDIKKMVEWSLDSSKMEDLLPEFFNQISYSSQEKLTLEDLLVILDFAKSKTDAKNKIRNGEIKINDEVVYDITDPIKDKNFFGKIKISLGKKNYTIVEFIS